MKSKSVFGYESYRDYLREFLEDNGFSYRAFAKQFRPYISLNSLERLLSKGRGKSTAGYRISPDSLARLGKAMGLPESELAHLILLKMENDADEFPGPHGNAYKRLTQKLVKEHRARATPRLQAGERKKISASGEAIAALFDELDGLRRREIAQTVVKQANIFIGRQSGKIGIKAVTTRIEQVHKLSVMGLP